MRLIVSENEQYVRLFRIRKTRNNDSRKYADRGQFKEIQSHRHHTVFELIEPRTKNAPRTHLGALLPFRETTHFSKYSNESSNY